MVSSVLSGEAPQERREDTVSSEADLADTISGVFPFLVFGCKETMMMMMMTVMIRIHIYIIYSDHVNYIDSH